MPKPLPLGEVSLQSNDGEGKPGEAEPVVEAITPVPGGVGTVTTSVLVSHVVEAAEKSV